MIADLQSAFGGDQMGWLNMPLAVLSSYVAAVPRVRANVALQHAAAVAVGTATMARKDAERWLSSQEAAAAGQRTTRPIDEDHRRALIMSAGITVG